MAVNPWSAALRSVPGYTTGTKTTAPLAPFTMPTLPSVPAIDDARAPNAASRSWIQTLLGNLPGKYNPLLTSARNDAQYKLAGYGGVSFGTDDPATPEREDLQVSFDPNAKLGQKEKQAVQGADMQALRSGDFYSSTHNQAVGAALVRMTEEKRDIVNQFSAGINNALWEQGKEATRLIDDWVKMFGADSQWLVDNPPPTPIATPGQGEAAYQVIRDQQIAQQPGNPDTPITAQTPAQGSMTYADFLRGRKSTAALARKWDATYNYGRRFGAA